MQQPGPLTARTTTTAAATMPPNTTTSGAAASSSSSRSGAVATQHQHHHPQRHHHRPSAGQVTPDTDSWVEVASQPSSSSLSSICDEIITTGLRIGSSSTAVSSSAAPARRRRTDHNHRPQPPPAHRHRPPPPRQDEEEDSETDGDDHGVIAVSGDSRASSAPQTPVLVSDPDADAEADDDSDADDGDDNATALGVAPPIFRPQPNAFSHPPAPLSHHGSLPLPTQQLRQHQQHQQQHRSSASRFSRRSSAREPYREDNDAALRASLTTLLSCAAAAAAARGPPKTGERASASGPSGLAGAGPRSADLRLLPESQLPDNDDDLVGIPDPAPIPAPPSPSRPSRLQSSHPSRLQRGTKSRTLSPEPVPTAAAAAAVRALRKRQKKKTALEEALVSPTLLTWVVGAGVVVLFSVVGFGAGYVIGREVGKQEALAAGTATGINATSFAAEGARSCGREVVVLGGGSGGVGLRKLRWGRSMMSGGVVA